MTRMGKREAKHVPSRQEGKPAHGQPKEQVSQAQALEGEHSREKPTLEELQAKLGNLARKLAAKEQELKALQTRSDRELAQAREEAKRALAQVRDLEAALAQAQERATVMQAELLVHKARAERLGAEKAEAPSVAPVPPSPSVPPAEVTPPPPPARPTASPLSPEQGANLYREALTPLTILSASADLLAMNPQMDASLRETITEIKAQSAVLLELIRKYSQPVPSE